MGVMSVLARAAVGGLTKGTKLAVVVRGLRWMVGLVEVVCQYRL